MCAGGPEETNSPEERELYGQNRISEGKVPVCAAMCSTKALLVGDSASISNIYRERVLSAGHGVHSKPYGWAEAYSPKKQEK
jgi:formate dehydrogenase iron-sulfur subunit